MGVGSEQAKKPHQAEGDTRPSAVDLLMRDLGATRWDPTPVDQHDFFLDEVPGESALQRALAWMRAHTIRRGRSKAYAVDEKGNELHIERLAADLGWKVKWAQEVWRLGESHGLFRRDPQCPLRLYLAGRVPRRASNLPSGGPDGSSRCTTASSRIVLPSYVERQIAKWDPDRRRAFLERIQIEEQWAREMKRDAMAAVRAVVDQRADSLFDEFGLERRRGTKRRGARETALVTERIDEVKAQDFAADSPNANGPAAVQSPPTSGPQSSEESVVQGGLYDEIPTPVQRSEVAVQSPPNGAQVIAGTADEPAEEAPSLKFLENDRGRTDPSSSDIRSSDIRGTTTARSCSKPNGPDLTPIDTAARQVCNPDTRFVRQIFHLCRTHAPDCTVEEVAAGVEEKIAIKRGRNVGNWMGYLLTAVPLMFEGGAFERFSKAQTASKCMAQRSAPPFGMDDLRAHLESAAAELPSGYEEIAASLRKLATDDELARGYADLEALEQRLTVLEEKMIATARARQSKDDVLESSREVERQICPYRGKMTANQLSDLEAQYRERDLLKRAGLRRLSMFYMR